MRRTGHTQGRSCSSIAHKCSRRPVGDASHVCLNSTDASHSEAATVTPLTGRRLQHSRALSPFHYLTLPGPHNARPGFAPVCSPFLMTCTPLTNTCFTPVAY